MSELYRGVVEQSWSFFGVDLWAPVRVVARLMGALLWVLGGYTMTLCVAPLSLFSAPWARNVRKTVARTWVRGIPVILGTRITVRGSKPAAPFVLVGNHISWMDFFVTHTLLDAACVTEALLDGIPIVGRILKGLDLIFVNRVSGELIGTNEQIAQAMAEGKSIVMAPEATVTSGHCVCHFHSALLEPVVRAGRPVHYADLTVRTPDGWPPASQVLITPDPDFPPKDDLATEAGCNRWGEDRGFVRYVTGLLSLPWHEYTITFAPKPISGTDRKTLAKDLRRAVQSIHIPVA